MIDTARPLLLRCPRRDLLIQTRMHVIFPGVTIRWTKMIQWLQPPPAHVKHRFWLRFRRREQRLKPLSWLLKPLSRLGPSNRKPRQNHMHPRLNKKVATPAGFCGLRAGGNGASATGEAEPCPSPLIMTSPLTSQVCRSVTLKRSEVVCERRREKKKNDYRRSSMVPSPVLNVIPLFSGQLN